MWTTYVSNSGGDGGRGRDGVAGGECWIQVPKSGCHQGKLEDLEM